MEINRTEVPLEQEGVDEIDRTPRHEPQHGQRQKVDEGVDEVAHEDRVDRQRRSHGRVNEDRLVSLHPQAQRQQAHRRRIRVQEVVGHGTANDDGQVAAKEPAWKKMLQPADGVRHVCCGRRRDADEGNEDARNGTAESDPENDLLSGRLRGQIPRVVRRAVQPRDWCRRDNQKGEQPCTGG